MGTVRPQIVLLGDSITQHSFDAEKKGWGIALANRYERKADVILRGLSGYNTRWVLPILDKIFPVPSLNPPLLVTVFLGANDAAVHPVDSVDQHVPLPEYKENLHKIVSHLKNLSDQTHIILIAPPPVNEEAFSDTSEIVVRRNEVTKLYAEECVKVGVETGVTAINLWSNFQEIPNWHELFCDAVHLSSEGNARLVEELVKILDQPGLVPTLRAIDMPLDFPAYTDLGDDPVANLKKWSTPK